MNQDLKFSGSIRIIRQFRTCIGTSLVLRFRARQVIFVLDFIALLSLFDVHGMSRPQIIHIIDSLMEEISYPAPRI